MRTLLIESDPITSRSVEVMLTHAGMNVYTTDLASEGRDLAKYYDYDLIITETVTNDGDALEQVLRQVRLDKITTPVMILSSDDRTETKIKAFAYGADDYLTKPFHREELIARINAVVRRSHGHAQAVIETGNVSVNLDDKVVRVGRKYVPLTEKEYAMMELLTMRKGATLTKETFLNHMYGGMDEPELKIVDVFMCKLRKKLAEKGSTADIATVWGRGYTLRDPEETVETEGQSVDA